ncbi:MAG TPA: lipase maturation factor family protein, partial [Pirellulales bacterium]
MQTKLDQSKQDPPDGRPGIIFDGDCSFCRTIVDRWRAATGERIWYEPYQTAATRYPQISDRQFRRAVHFVDRGGRTSRGAEAVLRAASECGRKQWLLWLYLHLSPMAMAFEFLYRLVAANRKPLTFLRRVWYGKDLKLPTYYIASAVFLRLLGMIYLIAFISLWTQITGLVGEHGILPVDKYLAAVDQHFAQEIPPQSPLWNVPTLAWLSPHDWFLNSLCATGAVLSVMLIVGLLPMLTAVLLWICYLSAFHVGQVFLGFQWDILLLETGFLAIFLTPASWRSKFLADRHPPRLAIWLAWWLLFRLMLESGAVKLTWNTWATGPDGAAIVANTWKSLTALEYHYSTQPLPGWTSWYMAQLPHWFQRASVLFLLMVELGLPWLMFGPRVLRAIACGGIILLMVLIGATGNYNFFNLLTIALAIMLLDDKLWPQFLRRKIRGSDWPVLFSNTRWRSFALVPFVIFAMWVGGSQVIDAIDPAKEPKESLESELGISQF